MDTHIMVMFLSMLCFLSLEKDLSLTVRGSCEGSHCFKLGFDGVVMPPCPTTFHFVKYNEPSLEVKLPKKKPRYDLVR